MVARGTKQEEPSNNGLLRQEDDEDEPDVHKPVNFPPRKRSIPYGELKTLVAKVIYCESLHTALLQKGRLVSFLPL